MAAIDDIRGLGYTVELVFADTYRVSGFGVSVYVSAGDSKGLVSLTDPSAHAERVNQAENGPPVAAPGLTTEQVMSALLTAFTSAATFRDAQVQIAAVAPQVES